MAYEFQDRSSDALYRGRELEFLLDDDKNIGEVYLDGDLIFQADEVFSEDQLRKEFRMEFEIIQAEPESDRSAAIDDSEEDFLLDDEDLDMSEDDELDLEERLYTKGGEYAIQDQLGNLREFIGDYHIHPKLGAMAGKFHTGRPQPILVQLDFEELRNIRLEGLDPVQQIDYTVDEIIDPDEDDISHEGSIMDSDRPDFY